MKRKIVKSGPSTLVVSLPSEFVNKHNLSKGDELEVMIKDNNLIFSSEKINTNAKILLIFDDIGVSTAWRFFNSAYCAGFSQIEIRFKNPDILHERSNKVMSMRQLLQDMANENVGLEIVELGKDYALFSELAEIKEGEIDATVKRMYHIIKSMIQICLENPVDKEQQVADSDIRLNKFANYAQRVITIKGFKNSRYSAIYSRLIDLLELIGDGIKRISFDDSKQIYLVLKEMVNMLDEIYFLHYNYSLLSLKKTVLSIKKTKSHLVGPSNEAVLGASVLIMELASSLIDRIIDLNQ